jgi:hypothetical protein
VPESPRRPTIVILNGPIQNGTAGGVPFSIKVATRSNSARWSRNTSRSGRCEHEMLTKTAAGTNHSDKVCQRGRRDRMHPARAKATANSPTTIEHSRIIEPSRMNTDRNTAARKAMAPAMSIVLFIIFCQNGRPHAEACQRQLHAGRGCVRLSSKSSTYIREDCHKGKYEALHHQEYPNQFCRKS